MRAIGGVAGDGEKPWEAVLGFWVTVLGKRVINGDWTSRGRQRHWIGINSAKGRTREWHASVTQGVEGMIGFS